jgi:hypothetical protein
MFNVIQRQNVNAQTFVTMRMDSSLVASIGSVSQQDLELVLHVLQKQPKGAALKAMTSSASPAAQAFLKALRLTSARVPGSPASFAHLRSCAAAPWNTFGMYTAFVTLNPCPLNARLVYKMAGHDYIFQADGCPDGRPELRERWSIICNNPAYCAMYFQIYMQEFCNVYLGWPQGAASQGNPDCCFGPVSAFFYKTECTGLYLLLNALIGGLYKGSVTRPRQSSCQYWTVLLVVYYLSQ